MGFLAGIIAHIVLVIATIIGATQWYDWGKVAGYTVLLGILISKLFNLQKRRKDRKSKRPRDQSVTEEQLVG